MVDAPTPAVRPFRAEDIPAMVDVLETVAGEAIHIGRELPIDREAVVAQFTGELTEDRVERFVALRDGDVVGHLGMHVDAGLAGLGMMLGPDARGRGLGSALMVAAVDWARSRPDVHKITLQHWPGNAAAHALYRKFGFLQEGYLHRQWKRRNGELWDAVLMGLVVEGPT